MQGNDKRAVEASRRAEGWLDANADAVPPAMAGQVAALKAANLAVAESATTQEQEARSSTGATVTIVACRTELRTAHLKPLARVARAVDRLTPELRAQLRLPDAHAHDETVIAASTAMARIGRSNEQVLIANGLAADFVAQLEAAAEALKTAIDARGQARARRQGARQEVHKQVVAGQQAVGALDVALTRVLRNDPARLAEWRAAKRVMAKGVRTAPAAPGGNGTTTPATPAIPTAQAA